MMSRPFLAAAAGLVLLLGLQTWRLDLRSAQGDQARAALERAEARHILFAERVRTKAEEIGRKALERARRAEAEQDRISQETSRDHQDRLAQLRAHYDRLLRAGADRADPGGAGGAAGLPALPQPAGGPDGAAGPNRLSLAERLLCSEQSLRLEMLQRWIREQQGVKREGEVPDSQP
jgi:hypothetical protein